VISLVYKSDIVNSTRSAPAPRALRA